MENTIIHCFMTLVCVMLSCVQTVLTAGLKPCAEIKGQPAFWDTMENRCSPCSANVCENQRPLDCLCHCIKNYSEIDYLPKERMMCETSPSELELTQGSIHQTCQMSLLQHPGVLAWMIIMSIMVLILYLRKPCTKVWKKWRSKRDRPKPPETVYPIYRPNAVKVWEPLLVQNNDPPPPNPQAAKPGRLPARNCQSPIQATSEHKLSDQTNVKCSAGPGNLRGTSKTRPHPSHPQTYGNTEGVPGHEYHLLPKDNRTSTL